MRRPPRSTLFPSPPLSRSQPPPPVAPQRGVRLRAQAAQRQHQKVAGIAEGMLDRPQAAVPDMAEADEGAGRHATPSKAALAGRTGKAGRARSRPSAASSPERRPSS